MPEMLWHRVSFAWGTPNWPWPSGWKVSGESGIAEYS